MSLFGINIIIIDNKKEHIPVLTKHFNDVSQQVNIIKNDIYALSEPESSDTHSNKLMVIPSNSYGILDKGILSSLNTMFDNIQKQIQYSIENVYYGEQPIGTCLLLNTSHMKYKYIAHLPITRYPNAKIQPNEKNIYYAFRSLLTTVLNHNRNNVEKITKIFCLSFCIEDNINIEKMAKEMRLAYGFIDIGMRCSRENAKIINDLLN